MELALVLCFQPRSFFSSLSLNLSPWYGSYRRTDGRFPYFFWSPYLSCSFFSFYGFFFPSRLVGYVVLDAGAAWDGLDHWRTSDFTPLPLLFGLQIDAAFCVCVLVWRNSACSSFGYLVFFFSLFILLPLLSLFFYLVRFLLKVSTLKLCSVWEPLLFAFYHSFLSPI